MKQIIDGKLYDTERAQLLGHYDHQDTGLYRSTRGNYFLCIYDGRLSTHGRYLRPISREEARRFAEAVCTPEQLQVEFGVQVEEA